MDEAEIAYHNALSYRPNMADAHYNLYGNVKGFANIVVE